jgi:uncharacterized coiled-coil DUF342 family protein
VATAAVAACAIAAGLLLWGQVRQARDEARTEAGRSQDLGARAADLQRQLTSAKQDAALAAGDQADQLAAAVRKASDALALADSAKARLTEAKAEVDAKVAELAKAAQETDSWKRRVEEESAKVARTAADANAVGVRLASAVTELASARKMVDEAQTAQRKAQGDLAEVQARQTALWNDYQQAYLAAAAPGETGLRAAQAAVRRSQLIERVAKLRAAADASQRPLLDKLEVVLTRLEMVEAGTFVSEDLFRKLLATSEVVKRLEEALDSRTLPPQARSVYFEARLILGGAERVG